MKLLKFLPLLVLMIAIAGFSLKYFSNAATHSTGSIGTVVRVADGDTLTIDLNGKLTKIRLCGIDAPEQKQALGEESKALLTKLALRKEVAITEIEQDRYGRTVAEVFVLGEPEQFVNSDLVEAGLAYHYDRYSGSCPNKDVIVLAETIAQSKKAGVWASANSVKPWDYRKTR